MVQAFVQHTLDTEGRFTDELRVAGVVGRRFQRGLDGRDPLFDRANEEVRWWRKILGAQSPYLSTRLTSRY